MLMKVHSFTVMPTTPPKLRPLLELANNMWFSWNWDARQVFAKLDYELWLKAGKNPLKFLCEVSQETLERFAQDDQYVAELEAVYSSFKKYLSSKTWFENQFGKRENPIVAYFSCEFGLHESLPVYSGGLGILAGDHLKSASDLGIPLVAIGLLYRQGYFRQGLNADGLQQEYYPENDWFTIPVQLQKDLSGRPITVSMNLGTDEIFFQVWLVRVGRVSLYLLDTNIPQNQPHHREITKRLYDADRDMRIRQEVLLGVGGVKMLKALNFSPSVYHINEGHSAFLILERLKDLMEIHHLTFEEAKEVVWCSNIFTTHTPVPAGNERFNSELIKKYLAPYAHHFSMTWNEFLGMGREFPHVESVEVDGKDGGEGKKTFFRPEEEFCMTILGLNFSSFSNGVSKLHGDVSRHMWKNLYPEIPLNEIPIKHITNGVHSKTWLSKGMEGLFVRYMQSAYVREISDFTFWKEVDLIPDAELWRTKEDLRVQMIKFLRVRLINQLKRRGASAGEIGRLQDVLDPRALTIGFARRFAPYKRAYLLFKDANRLAKLLSDKDRPVQIVFAGKAHPADGHGKEIIREIFQKAIHPDFTRKILFIEDYDMDVARNLVQGVDIWLNTPRRPLEASGTSGMKAALNGAINLSVLDGWWDEAFNSKNGWAIGHGEVYDNWSQQDDIEANLLYRLLECEVVPTFYNRDAQNVPQNWVKMMKKSIKSCGENYNAHRMVNNYTQQYYLKGERLFHTLSEGNFQEAKNLASWRRKLARCWEQIHILKVESSTEENIYAGDLMSVTAQIHLGEISSEDVIVEIYYGTLNSEGEILDPKRLKMQKDHHQENATLFKAQIPCQHGGRYGYQVRVLPGHPNLAVEFIPKLIKWES